MTVGELVKKYNLSILSESDGLNQEITGGYVGDLLSFVMAHAKEKMVWITIQGHINTIAVASLVGIGAIILTEGSEPTADMLEKAQENGIPVLTSPLSSFEIAYRFGMDQTLGGIG